ncbi:hypothetical protein GCM10011583_73830 [Streptomyces camponoticapitis]|uniref:Uncharacterized protein n=1 Tax=Streptomyces camponoticapitis TaxID=1616125 RepID=A0ABQ2EYJ6_9ACTN|nr:hypothetical protein GCM10011583_73830 [Streptomyces camponoticapitis]
MGPTDLTVAELFFVWPMPGEADQVGGSDGEPVHRAGVAQLDREQRRYKLGDLHATGQELETAVAFASPA